MLKILQVRLQQYVKHELPDVQVRFRKGRDQTATSVGLLKKQEIPRKTSTLFVEYTKHLLCLLNTPKPLWKILQEMGNPDHLTCLLRNLYAGQEATARIEHGTTDWFQIRKGVRQGCILSPCLFNLYAEYIMRNAGLDEAQAGIKIVGRNPNNL